MASSVRPALKLRRSFCGLMRLAGSAVTYGGMAKQALSIPPSLFIFKKLTAFVLNPSPSLPSSPQLTSLALPSTGFWLSNWVQTHPQERLTMMNELASLVSNGQLQEPATEVITLGGTESEMTSVIREVMRKNEGGKGKKVLLKFED